MRIKIYSLIFFSLIAANSKAQWVQWSANNHYYIAVSAPAGITWSQASVAAAQLTSPGGGQGQLVSITSVQENDFVFSLIDSSQFWRSGGNGVLSLGPWIGLHRDQGENGSFSTWVDGETVSYTNWAAGEPNNFNGIENAAEFGAAPNMRAKTWNDLSDNPALNLASDKVVGYVVEAVPEPSLTIVMSIGLFTLSSRHRRKN